MTQHDPFAILRTVPGFQLSSANFTHEGPFAPAQYGKAQGGGDLSPQLSWSGFPDGTKSFAVTSYDPDAPTGSGWWHWAVFNIPASITELPEGAGSPDSTFWPEGVITLKNDAGLRKFNGCGAPEGTGVHRYYFVVHALPIERLDLDNNISNAVLGFNLNFQATARAIIYATGEFGGAQQGAQNG